MTREPDQSWYAIPTPEELTAASEGVCPLAAWSRNVPVDHEQDNPGAPMNRFPDGLNQTVSLEMVEQPKRVSATAGENLRVVYGRNRVGGVVARIQLVTQRRKRLADVPLVVIVRNGDTCIRYKKHAPDIIPEKTRKPRPRVFEVGLSGVRGVA